LPTIRATVAEHMSVRGLPREKVPATVVHLLETTLIRVGNDEYARINRSYGLTTLKSEHVAVEGSEIRFQFTGKSGKQWSLAMRDRRVARIIRACQELPGQDPAILRRGQGAARRLVRRRQRLSQGDRRRRRHRQGFSHMGGNGADDPLSQAIGRRRERDTGQRALSAAVKREAVSGPSERTGPRPEEAAVLALLSGGQSGALSLRRNAGS